MYKVKVFLSYPHDDKPHKDRLEKYLAALVRKDQIDLWTDAAIIAGQPWRNEILNNLNASDLLVMLVSENFIASNFCYEQEFLATVKRAKDGQVTILPVLIRECPWRDLPIGEFQILPMREARPLPVEHWTHADDAYTEVVAGVQEAVAAIARSYESSLEFRAEKIESMISSGLIAEACNDLMGLAKDFDKTNDRRHIQRSIAVKSIFTTTDLMLRSANGKVPFSEHVKVYRTVIPDIVEALYALKMEYGQIMNAA